MTLDQVAKQMKFLLQAAEWPGVSPAVKVFHPDSVVVTEDDMSKLIGSDMIPPICAIRHSEAASDPDFQEKTDLFRQNIEVEIGYTNDGDRMGQNILSNS